MMSARPPVPVVSMLKNAGAIIALVLVVLAFLVGLRIGASSPSPSSDAHKHTHDDRDGQPRVYTCSMHPSVRLNDPDAKCPICFMDLIPVSEGDQGAAPDALRLTASQSDAARIETTPVVRHNPALAIHLYGMLRTDETTVERISAFFPGRIEKLYANFSGSRVNAGDHLAQVYSPDLLAAFEELHQAARSARESQTSSEIIRESSRQTLEASRDKLRLFGISAGLISRVEREGFDEDTFTIDAKRGGTITSIDVREGEYIQTGQPLLTIADLSHLWLDLQAYESQLAQIRWGQRVRFSVESHPGELFQGRVSFIDPTIDPVTRTAAVRVAVENPSASLKPGMFASAAITATLGAGGLAVPDELPGRWVCPMHPTVISNDPTQCTVCGMDLVRSDSLTPPPDPAPGDPQPSPLVIPASAVLFTGRRSIVYTQQTTSPDGQTYTPTQVTLGPRADNLYIVLDGLAEGQRVVTRGAFRVDSAMQIAAKPSMMTRDGEQPAPAGSLFAMRLTDVFAAYLDAQEALADDDLAAFNRDAARLSESPASVPVTELQGDDLALWRKAAADLSQAEPIDDIESARSAFERMSLAIFTLIDRFGQPTQSSLYIAHCPMAFDFRGADWLQRTPTIDNPYFGASMLQCGEIRREISPTPRESPSRPAPAHQHGGD